MSYMDSTGCIISETVTGYIDLKDCCYHTIWEAINLNASVTVKINNLSNQTMELKIHRNKNILIIIKPNDETNITATNVNCISIRCYDIECDRPCTGSYQILLHFSTCFAEHRKSSTSKCEKTGWYLINPHKRHVHI